MYKCLLCGGEMELDDVLVPPHNGRCFCLRCYLIAIDDLKPLPANLMREVQAVLVGAK